MQKYVFILGKCGLRGVSKKLLIPSHKNHSYAEKLELSFMVLLTFKMC